MKRQRGRKKLSNTCKAVSTRLIFLLHGAVSIYLLYTKNNLSIIYILLAIPMLLLIVESVITLCVRNGEESKYVWFCGLFYIATIVPIIWILELGFLQERQEKIVNIVTKEDQSGMLSEVLKMSNELDGRKVCEIGVIICIILGRWLTPRSSISRDQLSNLLLGYVANAADIMELFESLESPGIIYNTHVTLAVLVVYTWSLLQFTLVTTATMNKTDAGKDSRSMGELVTRNKVFPKRSLEGDMETGNEIHSSSKHIVDDDMETRNEIHSKRGNQYDETDRGPAYIQIMSQQNGSKTNNKCCSCCACHPEFFQIFVTLLMQDVPFLALRLALCLKFKVINELHIFFLCKNAIVSILLVYRIIILSSKDDTDSDDEYRGNGTDLTTNTITTTTTKMDTTRNDNGNDILVLEEHYESNNIDNTLLVSIEGGNNGYDNPIVETEDNTQHVL